jgi:hypothetical protein
LAIPADIFLQIEQDVIDEVMFVENHAIQTGQEVTTDVNAVISDVANEFNNVITPALKLRDWTRSQHCWWRYPSGFGSRQPVHRELRVDCRYFLTVAIIRVPHHSTNS